MSGFEPATEPSNLTPEQRASLLSKAYGAVDLLLANTRDAEVNADGNKWRLEFERKDLRLSVFNSEAKGSPIRRFKAVCFLPDISPDELMSFICDVQHRLTWDRNIHTLTMLQLSDDARGKVAVLRSATKQVGPISGRDFIDATIVTKRPDGSVINCGSGLDTAECYGLFPPTSAFVRGFNQAGTGWHVEPHESGSRVNYVIQPDLKGWFTAFIINQVIGGSYSSFFEDLQRALAQRKDPTPTPSLGMTS